MVDNHSVAVDLLKEGDWVMDAGALGFELSKWASWEGLNVMAYDPSPLAMNPQFPRVAFVRAAVVARNSKAIRLSTHGEPGAFFMSEQGFEVPYVHFPSKAPDGGDWAFVKLNVEGSEYEILDEWSGPTVKQIVVSFHEHTNRARGRQECDRLIQKMSQWYVVFNQVWERRYCCSENYWDVLFVRKDLA